MFAQDHPSVNTLEEVVQKVKPTAIIGRVPLAQPFHVNSVLRRVSVFFSRASFCSPSENEMSFFYPCFVSRVLHILSSSPVGHRLPLFWSCRSPPDRAAEGGAAGGRTWSFRQRTWPWQAGQDEDDNRQLGQVFGRSAEPLGGELPQSGCLNADPHSAQRSRGLYFETGF